MKKLKIVFVMVACMMLSGFAYGQVLPTNVIVTVYSPVNTATISASFLFPGSLGMSLIPRQVDFTNSPPPPNCVGTYTIAPSVGTISTSIEVILPIPYAPQTQTFYPYAPRRVTFYF